ncbi:MAG: hypothetical protein IT423_18985 [Pirellulaceae bacterium]|nr:hypothetical protein [Pirellulaceae bacterium]
MPVYEFSREAFAFHRQITRPSGAAFERPSVFVVKATDGTVIPIPLELLADEARIVVTQPEGPGPRANYAYIVAITNRKGKLIPDAIKKLGLKQATQRTVLTVIGLLSQAAATAAAKPVAALVGLLQSDSLGNDDASYKTQPGTSTCGKEVYFFLSGDRT